MIQGLDPHCQDLKIQKNKILAVLAFKILHQEGRRCKILTILRKLIFVNVHNTKSIVQYQQVIPFRDEKS